MQLKLELQEILLAREEQEEVLRRRERELTALKGALKEEVAAHDQEVDKMREQYEKEIGRLQASLEEAKQVLASLSSPPPTSPFPSPPPPPSPHPHPHLHPSSPSSSSSLPSPSPETHCSVLQRGVEISAAASGGWLGSGGGRGVGCMLLCRLGPYVLHQTACGCRSPRASLAGRRWHIRFPARKRPAVSELTQ